MATVRYPSGEEFEVVSISNVDDGIDYSDKSSSRGRIHLIRVEGKDDVALSNNFKVNEFRANDGGRSHYARISPDLVSTVQRIRDRVGRSVNIRNGRDQNGKRLHGAYRYPALQMIANPEAPESIHQAGEALDIWVQGMRGIQLAEIVLDVVGCNIGIGLGLNHVHFDLRGSHADWAYSPAAMNEEEFEKWVTDRCH